MQIRRLLLSITAAAAAAVLLAGCVDNSSPSTAPSTSAGPQIAKDAAAAKLLPAKVAASGKLVIGMDDTYPPNEYKDDKGQPIGWEVELATAIAGKLGLKATFAIASFDTIIPSITGGKDDIGVSSFTDTVEREKQVDFVNYYSAGIAWATLKGKTVDPDNACGLKVSAMTGATELTEELPAKSQKCIDAGKPAIQIFRFDKQEDATNAVILGQVDATSADSPVTAYAIKQTGGKLQAAGKTFDVAPYGFPVQKGTGMAEAVRAAVQSLIDDGTYGRILAKWGLEGDGLKTADVNAAAKG